MRDHAHSAPRLNDAKPAENLRCALPAAGDRNVFAVLERFACVLRRLRRDAVADAVARDRASTSAKSGNCR